MSQRLKAVCLVMLIFTSLSVGLYSACDTILGDFFGRLEHKEAEESLLRVRDIVQGDQVMLGSQAGDWASWDDAYDFVENGNQIFINKNISNASFMELKVNVILFVHNSGKIVYEGWYDSKKSEISGHKVSIRNHLGTDSRLLKLNYPSDSVTGILNLPEGPLMVAARPIVTTRRDAPIRGTLIMGRFLDDQAIARLSKESRISFGVARTDDPYLAPEFGKIQTELAENHTTLVKKFEDNRLITYAYLNDLYGNPTLILKTTLPRQMKKVGQDVISSLQRVIPGATMSAGLLLAVLLYFFCFSGVAGDGKPTSDLSGEGCAASAPPVISVSPGSPAVDGNTDKDDPFTETREPPLSDQNSEEMPLSEKPEDDARAPETSPAETSPDGISDPETGTSPDPDPVPQN